METWPVTLPNYGSDVSVKDGESLLISQNDAGPANYRNRFTAITQDVKTSMVMSGAQLAIFDTFFKTTLIHGSLPFYWTHPKTDETVTIRFKSKPEWKLIKPAPDANSRTWMGQLDLEIQP
jgi:hypothetical protein